MEPATPFATGEKVYNELTTPAKSFGQLFLSLIAMRRKNINIALFVETKF